MTLITAKEVRALALNNADPVEQAITEISKVIQTAAERGFRNVTITRGLDAYSSREGNAHTIDYPFNGFGVHYALRDMKTAKIVQKQLEDAGYKAKIRKEFGDGSLDIEW